MHQSFIHYCLKSNHISGEAYLPLGEGCYLFGLLNTPCNNTHLAEVTMPKEYIGRDLLNVF